MAIPETPSPLTSIIAAKTYNAAWFSGNTKEAQIQNAINSAALDGAERVFVPSSMLPYDASLVTFNTSIRMVREGGDPSVYDVMAYGAAGDGVTDDSAAIQAAVNGAQSSGDTVFLPAGRYAVTASLTLSPTPCIIRGAAAGQASANDGAIIVITTDIAVFTTTAVSGQEYRDIVLRDFVIDARSVTGTKAAYEISLTNPKNCRIDGVQIWAPTLTTTDVAGIKLSQVGSFTGGGGTFTNRIADCLLSNASIWVGAGVTDGVIARCMLYGNPRAFTVEIDAGNWTITECPSIVPSSVNGGIYVPTGLATAVKQLKLVGNFFDGNGSLTTGWFVNWNQVAYAAITGNTFWNGSQGGVLLTDCTNVSVTGNSFNANNRGANAANHDISIVAAAGAGGFHAVVGNTHDMPSARAVAAAACAETDSGGGNPSSCAYLGNVVNHNANYASPAYNVGAGATAAIVGNVGAQHSDVLPTQSGASGGFFTVKNKVIPTSIAPKLIAATETQLVSGVDTNTGNTFEVTLTAARPVGAPQNGTPGQRITVILVQDGVGAHAVTWNAVFKVSWSDTGNAASKRSTISFVYDGTNWNQDGAQSPYV